MTWFEFLLGVLATYRISLMVTKEHGVGFMFSKLRKVPAKRSATHEWLSCIFCFSVTVSAITCGLFWLADIREPWPVWILLWLSFSAGTIILNQTFTKGTL